MTNAMQAIRKRVFKVSQSEMAEIAGTTQATVSRWETDELQPDRAQLEAIRAEALRRGLEWNDQWIFQPVADDQSADQQARIA